MRLQQISENDSISALLRYGMSKFKSLLTPGRSDDIEMMLSFMNNGKTGYLKNIDKLIEYANNYDGDILKNNKWWLFLNKAFGFSDRTNLDIVIKNVIAELGGEEQQQPNQRQQPNQNKPTNTRRAKRHNVIDNISRFYRDTNRTQSEGIRDTFNNIRNAIANPKYLASEIDKSGQKARNNRIAKLAVLMFTNIVKADFEKKLKKSGLTIDKFKKLMKAADNYKKSKTKQSQP